MTTNTPYAADLAEVVALFAGARELQISHALTHIDDDFINNIKIQGKEYLFKYSSAANGALENKRLEKRYSKLALYRALSDYTGEKMPWGALTGIRPVKLARGEGENAASFLQNTMLVSPAKASLVGEILSEQAAVLKGDGEDFFVGIPFCPSRCYYCSFFSSSSQSGKLELYVDALVREIAAGKNLIKRLNSLYVGGGTPTSLPKPLFKRVLDELKPLAGGVEFTVEAGRPDCIDDEYLCIMKDSGVTRVCVNPQTMNDATLARIGRRHTSDDIRRAYAEVKKFGFDANMDLIAGLDGETTEDFCRSLDEVIALSPENITVHTLCLKRGSKLKETTDRLAGEQVTEMVEYAHSALHAAGYRPYYLYRQKYMAGNHENTGYTRPGKACLYNIGVMEELTSNIACGANAVSKRVFSAENRIERYGAPKDIDTYISKTDEIISKKAELFK